MKHFYKLLITVLVAFASSAPALANFEVNGINFYVISEENKTCGVGNGDSKYSGDIIIPNSVDFDGKNYIVTEIGRYAFSECKELSSVSLPNTITEIKDYAFYLCSGITTITIPNSVKKIRNYAFAGCSGISSVTIPNSVENIGEAVFANCNKIKNFYGKFASEDNRCLIVDGALVSFAFVPTGSSSYSIPDDVTMIGLHAFYGVYWLKAISLSKSLTSIRNSAFYGCTGLKTIEFPETLEEIGPGAFQGCSNISSIKIPESVNKISPMAFIYCSKLEAFYGKFASKDNRCLIVNGTLNSFAPSGLTEYDIPNTVSEIGMSVFENINGLTSITIPNSVETINTAAFFGCQGLTSITIPGSVTNIESSAFANCSKLTEISSMNPLPLNMKSDPFENIYTSDCVLKVPNVSIDDYKQSNYWSNFKNIEGLYRSLDLKISSEAGLATLWLDYDATIPEGVEVYYGANIKDEAGASVLSLRKIEDGILPRETGVIVKGTAGTYAFDEADEEGVEVESLLVGSATAKTFDEEGYKFYKLTFNNDGKNLGFYLRNSDGTIDAKPNRAYLKLTASSPLEAPTRSIGIDWGGEGTTEIETVSAEEGRGEIYNLQGVRVGDDYKGLVIKNGKKMIVK